MKEILFAVSATIGVVALCYFQISLLRRGNPKTDLLIALLKKAGEGEKEGPAQGSHRPHERPDGNKSDPPPGQSHEMTE